MAAITTSSKLERDGTWRDTGKGGASRVEFYFAHKGVSVKVVTKAATGSHYHVVPREKAIEDLSSARATTRGSCVKRNSTSVTKRTPLQVLHEVFIDRFHYRFDPEFRGGEISVRLTIS